MKQWKHSEFARLLNKHGFNLSRSKGSHFIYVNDSGRHISVPEHLAAPIARRLIKENNLQYD